VPLSAVARLVDERNNAVGKKINLSIFLGVGADFNVLRSSQVFFQGVGFSPIERKRRKSRLNDVFIFSPKTGVSASFPLSRDNDDIILPSQIAELNFRASLFFPQPDSRCIYRWLDFLCFGLCKG